MGKLEECVRSVQADGLLWGTSKLVPVGYGIKKLQIACVVEDEKVGTDLLEEEITKFEDFVSSCFSKVFLQKSHSISFNVCVSVCPLLLCDEEHKWWLYNRFLCLVSTNSSNHTSAAELRITAPHS